MRRFLIVSAIAMVASLTHHGTATANLITFTSEAAFVSATLPTSFESFEALPDRQLLPEPLVASEFTLTPVTTSVGIRSFVGDDGGATDGVKYVIFGDLNQTAPAGTLLLSFNAPITAFGLSIRDWGDVGPGSLSMVANAGEASAPLTIATAPPQRPNANVLFFGFKQDIPFTEVRLISTTANDGVILDEIYLTAVPEPSGLVSAALGLVALAGYAGWRRVRPGAKPKE